MTHPTSQQRDTLKQLSPPWLAAGNAEKFMFAIGFALDALLEKMNQAVHARMPGQGDPSALPFLGDDRVLTQGPTEPNAGFVARLQTAFETWQRAGARRAVLGQITAYLQTQAGAFASQAQTSLVVGGNGSQTTWDTIYNTMPIGAAPAHKRVASENWNWDGSFLPWRAWLVLFFPLTFGTQAGTAASLFAAGGGVVTVDGLAGMTAANEGQWIKISNTTVGASDGTYPIVSVVSANTVTVYAPNVLPPDGNNGSIVWSVGAYPVIGIDETWGFPGSTWGDGLAWGMNVPAATVTSVRGLVSLWKSQGTYYPWIVFCFDGSNGTAGSSFSPNSATGSGNPDGTWGTWAKTAGGVSLAARQTTADTLAQNAFADGTGIYGNCSIPTQT